MACEDIRGVYLKRGYFLAKVYLPEQNITSGVVTITILEGEIGTVTVVGSQFYHNKFILSHFRASYKGVLNYKRLLKTLLVLNDYPDLKVFATLSKGIKPGTVDISIKAVDALPFHGELDYNNFGTKYVSRDRLGTNLELTNIVFGGDTARFRYVAGMPWDSTKFIDTGYTATINPYGTKAGFEYTWSNFKVGKEFKDLDSTGDARIYGFNITHPVTRTQAENLDINFGFDYKIIRNLFFGQVTSDDQLRVFKLGARWDNIDDYMGRNYFSVLGSMGVKDMLHGLGHDDPMASRAGAGGDFTKVNIDAARYQKLIWDMFLLLKVSSQIAGSIMTTPEEFSVGGSDSVRGYPQSETLGDGGFTGTLELRAPPPVISDIYIPVIKKKVKDFVQILGFIDYGSTFKRNPQAGEKRYDNITGIGFGARVTLEKSIDFRVDAGWPVGRAPDDGSNGQVTMQVVASF